MAGPTVAKELGDVHLVSYLHAAQRLYRSRDTYAWLFLRMCGLGPVASSPKPGLAGEVTAGLDASFNPFFADATFAVFDTVLAVCGTHVSVRGVQALIIVNANGRQSPTPPPTFQEWPLHEHVRGEGRGLGCWASCEPLCVADHSLYRAWRPSKLLRPVAVRPLQRPGRELAVHHPSRRLATLVDRTFLFCIRCVCRAALL